MLLVYLIFAIAVGSLLGMAFLRQQNTNDKPDLIVDDKNKVIYGDYTVHKRRRRQQPVWYE